MMSTRLVLVSLALSVAGVAAASEVVVDASKKHQVIDGFGTCLISWDDRMAKWYEQPEAARIFADELRFNILRCNLWGDGTIGPVDDPAKISFRDPAFAKNDPRTPVFLKFAKAVRRYNPRLKVIGTVWSPPAWMKVNNATVDDRAGAIQGDSYLGEKGGVKVEFKNRVRSDRYQHFARWLVEMVKYYEANGVPMYAVSAANEPQFTQSFESCVWTAADLARITGLTAQVLRQDGLGRIKLFGPETMTGFNWDGGPNYRYTTAMRNDKVAWSGLGFWATHGYADGVRGDVSSNSSAKFWSIIANDRKPYWVTEGGTGEHQWPAPVGEKGVGIAIHNALVAGNASAFVPWQYAENSRSEHNLMPLSGLDKKTHVVRHYSRYIPAGSRRVDAIPAYGDVNASAFVHGKDVTVVLLNTSNHPQTVTVRLKGVSASVLNVVRTSASEDSHVLAPLRLRGGRGELEVPGPGIVTLSTLH
jgi:O-glycosyl hydrolase